MEQEIKRNGRKRAWTPEEKAELRTHMPKKMNKLGEWFFSDDATKEYIIIVDEKAVLQ